MTEEEWLNCEWGDDLVNAICRQVSGGLNKANMRRIRLARCGMLRCEANVADLLLRDALELAEQFADGNCTESDLQSMKVELTDATHLDENTVWRCKWLIETTRGRRNLRHNNPRACYIRDIFGNPFRPVSFEPEWRTSTVVSLARSMYESRDFSVMPILADALQDAGCEHADILDHCRGTGPHVRGCWVVDLVLAKA